MKKLALIMALVMILSAPMEATATAWTLKNMATLDFQGTAAVCQATVTGDRALDEIVVTMTLKLGDNYITSWTESGYGYVHMRKTTYVGVGSTYTLIVDVTMNGVAYDPISVEKACWP